MVGPARPTRLYVDTSVIGGCLDDEFRTPSIRLFDRSRAGGTLLVVSDITLAELASAPAGVRSVIEDLPRGCLELIRQNAESDALAEEYIRQAVVSRRMLADAPAHRGGHSGKGRCARELELPAYRELGSDPWFNAVNLRTGYPLLEIRSPLEVWKDDDEDF